MNESDLSEKAKRGWWASVVFMLLIVAPIIFLSYVKIVEENRDILIGIIGMLTGSISSMLAIASGRDPNEMDELKGKLATANADRQALIARLRDAQIQMQLLRTQIFELQTSVIEKLSVFVNGEKPIQTHDEHDVRLPEVVQEWLPADKNEAPDEEGEEV